MKKRFLSFLLTLTMLLTILVIPSYADGDTTLTLDSYNIITNAIRLEFSNTITAVTDISVTTADGEPFAGGTPSISGNVVNVKLTDKMDIEKKYILDFIATDGTNTLAAKKIIEFDVYWNDDFESYTQSSDLDAYYRKLDGTSNRIGITSLTGSGLEIEENGNKKMKIDTPNDVEADGGVWIIKSPWPHKYFTFEADFESISPDKTVTTNSTIFDYHTQNYFISNSQTIRFSNLGYKIGGSNMKLFTETKAHHNVWDYDTYAPADITDMTVAISTYQIGASDAVDIFWDSNNVFHDTGSLNFTANGNMLAAISPHSTSSFYIDNWKIYKATLSDYVETGIKHCNVTTKAIQIVYNSPVDIANVSVTLKNGANSVNTTSKFDTANNTLVITPENPLDLSKVYTLNVTGVYDGAGIELPEFSKTFEFETLWYDDFESYTSASDLDEKYRFAKDDFDHLNTASTAAGYTIVNDAVMNSKVLQMNTSDYAIMPKMTGAFVADHTNKYHTLEFDIRSKDDCWRFEMPMYKYGSYDVSPFVMFTSHLSNMYIKGLFGMAGYGTVENPAPLYPDGLTTMAITVDSYNDNGDFEGLFYNGVPERITTDYKFTDTRSRHFGFRASVKKDAEGNQVDNIYYIDNLKAYKVKDVSELPDGNIVCSGAVIDSEKITLTYDKDVTADVSLTADGEDYAVNTTFADNKIVIKPSNSEKFDMNKQYDLKVTNIADRFGRLAPSYEKKFRFKLIWEDDFSSYNEQADLDGKYFIIGGYNKPSEVMNTESDYLYKLDAENDRLILNGTDGITSLANQFQKKFIMPNFDFNGLSLEYWKDYSFEYTLSKDEGAYYRVESYYNPWMSKNDNGDIIPADNYNWIYYGVWYPANKEAAQIILDGNKTATVATPGITDDVIDMKITIDEGKQLKVYKNGSELYANDTSDWEKVAKSVQFAFRNAGVAGDKYYLDNLLAYKVIYIDDNDLYLTDVSYANNKVTANVNVTSDEANADGKVFIAAYDEDYKLVGVSETAVLALGEAIPVEISNASNARYVKAFAWGDNDIKPLFYTDLEAIK